MEGDGIEMASWSDRLLHLALRRCNSFSLPESSKQFCTPFLIGGKRVGFIRPDVWSHFKNFTKILKPVIKNGCEQPTEIHLSSELKTFEERTQAVGEMLCSLRSQNVLRTLKGWRNECYAVYEQYGQKPLLEVERSAACLFGIKQYGVHINGYVVDSNGDTKIWIAQRASTKQTWPGYYDNMVAGGLTSGMSIKTCAVKECAEEASIPEHMTQPLKNVGCVSYFYEDPRGLFPECEFVLDLKLPEDFTPVNDDGEVQKFMLMGIEEVKDFCMREHFKPNSALITIDFLMRHGFITPDNEPNYARVCELMHVQLP